MMPDSLDIASRVADRLGMTWGMFSAMCRDMYPTAARPIWAYIDDPANHADTSPPDSSHCPASGRVHVVRYCRWCGAEVKRNNELAHYCTADHQKEMVLHKAAIRNRTNVILSALHDGRGDEAQLRYELYGLKAGIRPGKGMEKQCPQTVAKLKETETARNEKLLAMIEEEHG